MGEEGRRRDVREGGWKEYRNIGGRVVTVMSYRRESGKRRGVWEGGWNEEGYMG